MEIIDSKTFLGLAALLWLVGSLALVARTIRTGRALADALAARHPDLYETLGQPRPGYFASVRRTRFAEFVGQREFENLPDGALASEFEAYRKAEARVVIGTLACGGAIAVVGLALGHFF